LIHLRPDLPNDTLTAGLAEANNDNDLNTWLNKVRLLELWPTLYLPRKVARIWEERFPQLGRARCTGRF